MRLDLSILYVEENGEAYSPVRAIYDPRTQPVARRHVYNSPARS